MASTFEFLFTLILFTLFIKGHGQCELEDITVITPQTSRQIQGGQCALEDINVTTQQTSKKIQGKPEWLVSIINSCKCAQKALVVSSYGFQTVRNVDPNVFSSIGNGRYCINGGRPIGPSGKVEFHYAWDHSFRFTPISSKVAC